MKNSLAALFYLLLFFSGVLFAQVNYPALEESIDPGLQSRLENTLQEMGLARPAEDRKLALALVDITLPESPRVARVNGDSMMYAASLPKIAILLGAFERIEQGTLPFSAENRELMTLMIRNSSNRAATTMLNRVGRDYLASLLQSPRYRLYDPAYNGGLWVGKEYGKGAAFRRDPLHNLSHGATAMQVARFYYYLETDRLVSSPLSAQMKEMLGEPAINHKFVKGMKERFPDAELYRKSGSWRQYHADSAIVERDGRRYIAVGLAENQQGGQWLTQLIVEMDRLIFATQNLAGGAVESTDAGA